jgi:hypothetical protein
MRMWRTAPWGARLVLLVFWIERLIPGEGRQAFVTPEHNQELGWCSGGDDWEPSVGAGTQAPAADCSRSLLSRLLRRARGGSRHLPQAPAGAGKALQALDFVRRADV